MLGKLASAVVWRLRDIPQKSEKLVSSGTLARRCRYLFEIAITKRTRKSCLVIWYDIRYPNFNVATFTLHVLFSPHPLLRLL